MSEAQSSNPEPVQSQGVLGDGALQAGRYNMALVRRAIRDDYPISPELRRALIDQMGSVLRESKSKRSRVAAAKVILAADGINVKREQMDQKGDWWQMKAETPPDETNVNVNVAVLNTDDKRTGLAALASIRERLGIAGQPVTGTAQGNGSVDTGANGKASHHPPNGSNGAAADPNGSSG